MNDALPLAKYHQIYLVLRERLLEGRFDDGLPGELSLTREFGVGRVTVRRALEQLAREGLIVRQAGRGTRPVRPAVAAVPGPVDAAVAPAARLSGLLENIVSVSRQTTARVLDWRLVPATAALAQALQVPVQSRLRKVIRVRSTAAGPVSYITTHLPEERARHFSRADLLRKPLLQLLQESGVELGRARQTVSARSADAEAALHLKVAVGTALLSVRRLVFDTAERPVQLLHGLYRPDRYEYQMELSQVGGIDARVVAQEIGS